MADGAHRQAGRAARAGAFLSMRGLALVALSAPQAGCGDDACEAMCDAAEARVAACLEDDGRTWSDLGWSDVTDFRDFCATWVEEARAVEQEDTCPEMTSTFEEGTCSAWPSAFAGPR